MLLESQVLAHISHGSQATSERSQEDKYGKRWEYIKGGQQKLQHFVGQNKKEEIEEAKRRMGMKMNRMEGKGRIEQNRIE